MGKQLIIKIDKDGTVNAKTIGIKGKQCEKYISIIENLTESQTVDSEYTEEYYESETQIDTSSVLRVEEKI